jgi:ketosteroid isomerase-like protein
MTRSLPLILSAILLSCCTVFAQSDPAQAASPSATGVTSTDTSEVAQFQKIEENWSNAVNMHDQYALELVLSPLFVDIAANGNITTRNQQLAAVINPDDKSIHLEQRAITVRMLGDTAVVNGTYSLRHKAGSGPAEERGIFTHVFTRHRNGWLCINSQRTVLHEEVPGGKKKKSSEAEQPFHIPLFSKDSDKNEK